MLLPLPLYKGYPFGVRDMNIQGARWPPLFTRSAAFEGVAIDPLFTQSEALKGVLFSHPREPFLPLKRDIERNIFYLKMKVR
jgi:hypothetical protein